MVSLCILRSLRGSLRAEIRDETIRTSFNELTPNDHERRLVKERDRDGWRFRIYPSTYIPRSTLFQIKYIADQLFPDCSEHNIINIPSILFVIIQWNLFEEKCRLIDRNQFAKKQLLAFCRFREGTFGNWSSETAGKYCVCIYWKDIKHATLNNISIWIAKKIILSWDWV